MTHIHMIRIMRYDMKQVFRTATERQLDAGQPLFISGDPVQSVHLVRSGRVLLVRHTRRGQPLALNAATTGGIVAEASVYSQNYHCDAVATEATVIAGLPIAVFRSLVHADPELSKDWAAMLATSLQAARMRAEIRTLGKIAHRLDAWLEAGNELPPRGHLQEVAAEIGVTREALYRELSRRRSKTAL